MNSRSILGLFGGFCGLGVVVETYNYIVVKLDKNSVSACGRVSIPNLFSAAFTANLILLLFHSIV
jgi:hypothetical protein